MPKSNCQYQLILVGLGRVAIKHIKAYYHLKQFFNSLILVEPNRQSADNFVFKQRKYLPQTYHILPNLQAVFDLPCERERIVAITTPSNLHYEQAKLALLNNCHCLIEKPVTLDLAEAEELLNISREKNLQVAIGHIYRYIPLVKELQAELANGLLGRIFNAKLDLEWGHEQAYYDQAKWRGSYAHDGGVLMNQSIHALDLLFYLVNSQFNRGTAYLDQLNHRMEAEDYAACLLLDNHDRQFSLNCTTASLPTQHTASFKIFGEKGDLTLSMHNKKFKLSYHNAKGHECRLPLLLKLFGKYCKNLAPSFWTSWVNPHQAIYADLIHCIETKSSCLADLQSGINALKAVLTLYGAAKEHSYTNSLALPNTNCMSNYFKK